MSKKNRVGSAWSAGPYMLGFMRFFDRELNRDKHLIEGDKSYLIATIGARVGEHVVAMISGARRPREEYRITDSTFGCVRTTHSIEATTDCTTVDVWAKGGLVSCYLQSAMELKTRRVCVAGYTHSSNESMMKQIARNLTDEVDAFLNGKRSLTMDRDAKFCAAFRSFLKREGI